MTAVRPNGSGSAPSDVLPGATIAELAELNTAFDTRDGYLFAGASGNTGIAERMSDNLQQEMTGYPPEVVGFEQRQLDLQGMLVDLPPGERDFYGGELSALSTGYQLETDEANRFAISRKVDELGDAVRSEYNRAINDPVDRALGVFNRPMGEGYLGKEDREDLDRLERLREDFLDATDSVERRGVYIEAAEFKALTQAKIDRAITERQRQQQAEWHEANGEVDRILNEAQAQTDPAKRYELPGRQLFQNVPGHDSLKDKVMLAFTQRMRDSEEVRNKLNTWHAEVSRPLNALGVSGPKRYTDILGNPPPVSADYLRALGDQYTDVLRDASHKNDSITPRARAEKLVTQILEGVMRVMAEMSPVGLLADLVPSTLPGQVRSGIEAGGMLLGTITGLGIGRQVGRAAKALVASAREVELDDMVRTGIRTAGRGLVDDASERIVKGTLAEQASGAQAQAAEDALERRALAEAGPPADPDSQLAHEAVGTGPLGSPGNYADPDVDPRRLRAGLQPGILEHEGERYIEMAGKAFHVRFDSDNDTWRVFMKGAPWKPQYAVMLDHATGRWVMHGDVGLRGGGRKISESVRQDIIQLLNAGAMSQRQIAATVGVTNPTVARIVRELKISLSAPATLRHLGITPATREEAIRLLREGVLPRSDIAARLGISRPTVSRIARDNGIAPMRVAGGRGRIPPELRQQVQDLLLKQNLSDYEIAKTTGISRNSVGVIRRGMQLPVAVVLKNRTITPDLRREVVRQLEDGAGTIEVARSNGLSRTSVLRIGRQAGIPPGGLRKAPERERVDQVFALREQGQSVQAVAEAVGLPPARVRDMYAHVNADTYKRSWWDTTPAKRTAVLRRLDDGDRPKDVARELALPLETVRGIANQHRMARDSLASELSRQGQSADEIAAKLGLSSEYVKYLRRGVPEGTHDIHWHSGDAAAAMDMFQKGYTREEVAEKLGVSRWQAHRLANEYITKTMDSVTPPQLADIVRALDDQNYTFTTSDLARAAKLPESTVAVVEHEYLMGFITKRAGSPVARPSSGTQAFGNTYGWVRPLSLEQEVRAMREMDRGQDLANVAGHLQVELPAVARLYEEDLPLVAADAPAMPSPGKVSSPAAGPLSAKDVAEIRKLAGESQLTPAFIAGFLGLSPDEVVRAL